MNQAAIAILLAKLVVLLSPSARAITVDLYVESSLPLHSYVSDDEDIGEFATTAWRIAPVTFPALAGETGMLTIRFNAPIGKQFITTAPITDFQANVDWRSSGVSRPGLVFYTSPVFANAPVPGSLNWSNINFRPPFPDDSANVLDRVVMSTDLSDIPTDFRFSSLEVSIPIDEVLIRFPFAGEIPLRSSCLCFSIIGDVPPSARQGPFVVLAPVAEPSTNHIAFIGALLAAAIYRLRQYRAGQAAMYWTNTKSSIRAGLTSIAN